MAWAVVGLAVTAGAQEIGRGIARKPKPEPPLPLSASELMASTVMREWPAGVITTLKHPGSWGYEEGVLLDGMLAEWRRSGNRAEFAYVKQAVDRYVKPDGTIQMDAEGKSYPEDTHTLDDIEMGRAILGVYRVNHEQRYATAVHFLEDQLTKQPRTASGGYWHKQIYPNQMWLDGAFMAEPFRIQCAVEFHEDAAAYHDIAKQLLLMDEHMRDDKSGLLRHGWDESKTMPWADKEMGLSPAVWARAMGWYTVALVDVLDWMPKEDPDRAAVLAAFKRSMAAVVKVQDPASGLWWQVMDMGAGTPAAGAPGNFLETSASAMFVYSLARGARRGYLPESDDAAARRGWNGIQQRFLQKNPDGGVRLTGTVKVGGLGGTPYRPGTPEYYFGEATGDQDAKGVGAYLMAASEMVNR
jgi:unsaturated rhamnogalacturonyl hydrolase